MCKCRITPRWGGFRPWSWFLFVPVARWQKQCRSWYVLSNVWRAQCRVPGWTLPASGKYDTARRQRFGAAGAMPRLLVTLVRHTGNHVAFGPYLQCICIFIKYLSSWLDIKCMSSCLLDSIIGSTSSGTLQRAIGLLSSLRGLQFMQELTAQAGIAESSNGNTWCTKTRKFVAVRHATNSLVFVTGLAVI